MNTKVYLTDLSEKEWELIAPLLLARKEGGRPATYSWRSILNACFYLVKTGCQWRRDWKATFSYEEALHRLMRSLKESGQGEEALTLINTSPKICRPG
jgi:putative transposase